MGHTEMGSKSSFFEGCLIKDPFTMVYSTFRWNFGHRHGEKKLLHPSLANDTEVFSFSRKSNNNSVT